MNDQILASYTKSFALDHELDTSAPDDVFEHFVNFTVVSKLFGQSVDPVDVSTGKAYGIDGIAIFVNDQLVLGAEEVADLSRTRLDAHFVFIQSKTAPKFEIGDILKFVDAVKGFFGPPVAHLENEQISRFRHVKDEIYKKSIKMEIAPVCDLYYVTCGKWQEDPRSMTSIEQAKEGLRATGLFSAVKFTPVDADKLKSYYRALKQQIVKQITFEKYTVLPRMQDVDQAYVGVLPAKEYLKLIVDADGNLERNLFYDNVRDFQGDNAVNMEISTSIRANASTQDKFAILNNGITIVAREIRPIGTEFTVRDYQIVNGCQTSHVLYFNRAFVTDSLHIPVKFVATSSQEVTSLVTKATNWQTQITEEAFAALEPFHKKLEEFYASTGESSSRLYYERRSRQYDRENISPTRIVSIAVQTKAYVSMLSGEPHTAHHYYGELLRMSWQSKKEMYQEDHDPWPYHVAALSYVELDKQLKTPARNKHRAFRHHILHLLGRKFFGDPPHNIFRAPSKKIASACEEIVDFWKNKDAAAHHIDKLIEVIDNCYQKLAKGEHKFDSAQRREFTDAVNKAYDALYASPKPAYLELGALIQRAQKVKVPRLEGKVKRIGVEFGFIVDSKGDDVFFHRSAVIRGNDNIGIGSKVEFTPVLAPRGLKALDVIVLT